MKVLIVGGTGIISKSVTIECSNRKFETYVLNRGNNNKDIPNNVTIINGNMYDINEINKVLENQFFDVVIDFLIFSLKQLKNSIKIFKNKCKQYIFISTTGIYKRNGSSRLSENAKLGRKQWDYNKEKIKCEMYLHKHKNDFEFKYTIVRPAVTYDNRRVPFPVVDRSNQWALIDRIKNGKPIISSKNVEFSIINSVDFANAFVTLFLNEKAYYESFHIAFDKTYKWNDVIQIIADYYNVKPIIVELPISSFRKWFYEIYKEIRFNKSDPLFLDNKKIKNICHNHKETISLQDGVNQVILNLSNSTYEYDGYWNDKIDCAICDFNKKKKDENLKVYLANKKINFANLRREVLKNERRKKYRIMLSKIKHILIK